MKANAIRSSFLEFFRGQGHTVVPSAPLIPQNDPTLFFVNAGMVPFKDLFTGAEVRDYTRATSSQRCLRVSGKHNDLDNVGQTPRHHTFFEMLGNFSFGDYFKTEAIPMAWELIRGVYGIPEERLWVTIFEDDDEAYEIWRQTGVPGERIQRMGAKDNFWSMGPTGPCGPCTEIFYDHGPKYGREGGPAADDHRYIEIWNLVLMQFEQHADGSRTNLPKPSIDTGSGLERVAAALQGHFSNYDTDLFVPLIQRAAKAADVRYGADDTVDTALRVIADHARATTFLVADGVMPSNMGRGYVLRRIMRRAIRYGVKIGLDAPFMHEMVDQVVLGMGEVHEHLLGRHAFIDEVVRGEEDRFRRTLSRGMALLDGELEKAGQGGTIPGDMAFQLSDTYGFPVDLTELIAKEHGVGVDMPGFDAALEAQKERGRAAWKGSGQQAVDAIWHEVASEVGDTVFVGYDTDTGSATVAALVKRTGEGESTSFQRVAHLEAGDEGAVILDRTTLYGEGGGQVGDSGRVGTFEVTDVQRSSGLFVHEGRATARIEVGDDVTTVANSTRRGHTKRNHTATHLLHAALRQVLGTHVTQKGSLVGPARLRFDFSHHKPMTSEEIEAVEDLVNAEILKNTRLTSGVHTMDAAKDMGAMALFGEKYGDNVRVVSVPGFSVELCGGTHVDATGDIGSFRILAESGIAAGVRRIEAHTGANALEVYRTEKRALMDVASALKTSPDQVLASLAKLADDKKAVERELAELKRELAKAAAGDLLAGAREIGGIRVVAATFDGDLKEQADRLRDQLGSGVVVLGTASGKSVQLVAAVTGDLAGKRVHAGRIISAIAPIVGGKGGGRPDMAQGGGKDAEHLPRALEGAYDAVRDQLAAQA
ncbi:MAG: alanine--tRNA ligase [Alphaproteobacteria bacterium]|nr:alanine--tRNA ligase [Alphaproteobacteria bacterium]